MEKFVIKKCGLPKETKKLKFNLFHFGNKPYKNFQNFDRKLISSGQVGEIKIIFNNFNCFLKSFINLGHYLKVRFKFKKVPGN